jgi:hypothetical protein
MDFISNGSLPWTSILAVVTNITHEHLDYHGTREAYVAAKALLFRALFASPPKPGVPRAAQCSTPMTRAATPPCALSSTKRWHATGSSCPYFATG